MMVPMSTNQAVKIRLGDIVAGDILVIDDRVHPERIVAGPAEDYGHDHSMKVRTDHGPIYLSRYDTLTRYNGRVYVARTDAGRWGE